MQYKSTNEKQTLRIANDFAKRLRGGEIILLSGNLGAGKTVFVKGLAKGLKIKGVVKSPTFNLMKCYSTEDKSLELCHVDAYRLENLDDLTDIGIEDYVNDDSIIIIEWSERVQGIEKLGNKIIKVKIDYGKKKDERKIEII